MKEKLAAFREQILALHPVRLDDYRDLWEEEFPAILALERCEQNPRWHAEGNVYLHTQWVMNETLPLMSNLSHDDALSLYLSGLLHDIGKPQRTQRNEHGEIGSPGHEEAGVHLAREILHKLGLPYHIRRQVAAQVAQHYMPYTMVRRQAPAHAFVRLSHELNTRILYLLELADFRGRTGEGIEARLSQIDEFRRQCEAYQCFGEPAPPLLAAEDLATIGILDPAEQHRIQQEILHEQVWGRMPDRETAIEYATIARRGRGPHLYLPVGLPGAGKSTWVAQHLPRVRSVSMDEKRAELLGDAGNQSQNDYIFRLAVGELAELLREGYDVVFDATNRNQRSRRLPLAIARQYHATTTLIYFDLPLDVVLSRNAQRSRQVPAEIIHRLNEDLEAPEVYEGAEIIVVEERGEGGSSVPSPRVGD